MLELIIADDEIWVAQMIVNLIDWEANGFHIAAVCHNGLDALQKVKELQPALVLTDIKMPGMGGLELIAKAREANFDAQFVIISGYNDFEYAKEAISYGAAGYLLKPLGEKELLDVISRVRDQVTRTLNEQQEKARMESELSNTLIQVRRRMFLDLLDNAISDIDFEEYQKVLNADGIWEAYQTVVLMTREKAALSSLEMRLNAAEIINSRMIQFEKTHGQYIVMLFGFSIRNSLAMKSEIQKVFYSLQGTTEADLCLGFGNVVTEPGDIPGSYNTAMVALSYRHIYGWNMDYEYIEIKDRKGLLASICSTNMEINIRASFYDSKQDQLSRIISELIGKANQWAQKSPSILIESASWLSALCANMLTEMYGAANAVKEMIQANQERIIGSSSLDDLKASMIAFYKQAIDYKQKRTPQSKNQMLAQEAKAFIDQNYMQDIGLNDVAEAVHLNPNYFSTLFKDETKTTFKAYLTQKRIEVAKKLLRNDQYRMNEIANLVGYNDVKQFSHMFKKALGITPSEYRKIMVGHE